MMRYSPRLTRSLIDRVLGGVGGGLGEYLAINPWWIRALFIVLTIATFGAGALIYLLLWVTLPEQTLYDIDVMQPANRRTRPETLILIGGGVALTGIFVLALNLGVFNELDLDALVPFGVILVGLMLFAQQLRRLAS